MAAKNPSNQLEKTTIICYFQKLIYIIFWPTLLREAGRCCLQLSYYPIFQECGQGQFQDYRAVARTSAAFFNKGHVPAGRLPVVSGLALRPKAPSNKRFEIQVLKDARVTLCPGRDPLEDLAPVCAVMRRYQRITP